MEKVWATPSPPGSCGIRLKPPLGYHRSQEIDFSGMEIILIWLNKHLILQESLKHQSHLRISSN